MASVGVSAPGHEIFLLALVTRMTSGCRLGLTTNSAPASIVACACSAVVTVPEPSRSFAPYSLLSSLIRSTAPGTVIVTSTMFTPPAIIASTTARPCATLFARSTGINPTRSMISCVVSGIPVLFDCGLASDACRAALHQALDLGQGRHAGVSGSGHRQRAVCHTAFQGPLDPFTGEQSVDQARGKAVAAADAVENVDLALGHVHDLVFIQRN